MVLMQNSFTIKILWSTFALKKKSVFSFCFPPSLHTPPPPLPQSRTSLRKGRLTLPVSSGLLWGFFFSKPQQANYLDQAEQEG